MDSNTHDSWGSESDRFQEGTICIGIDLGTTNSCVGMWHVDRNHVKILRNHSDRGRTTPSVVHFVPDSEQTLVGNRAIAKETAPVGNTIRAIKRLMGQKYNSKAREIANLFSTYSIVETKQGNAAVAVTRHNERAIVQPEEVSSYILADLKYSAEAYWNHKKRIDNVVITVPAYSSDSQRKATILSAQMAGFKAIRLLNEPTAAAMAYGLFVAGAKNVVVFDFGGGTLDVSLMLVNEGRFEVLGIGGDTNLGGEDVNNLLIAHVLGQLEKQHRISASQLTSTQLVQVKRAVEVAKIELSTVESTVVELVQIHPKVPLFRLTMARCTLESVCESIWNRCLRITSQVLTEAEMDVANVDEVVMVGGSTRIPIIRERISAFFQGRELCLSVNADEVVCEGAAIQAAILSGMDKKIFQDVLMMDVIPLPIGLETVEGHMEILLPKNARIPVTKTKYFETYEDGQRGLSIDVFEGENEQVAQSNDKIASFSFPLPRDKLGRAGEFSHPVTFTMNANGILQVQAGIYHDSVEAPMSTTALVIMGMYLVALVALYVFARIYFAIEPEQMIG